MARKNRLNDQDFSAILYVLSPIDLAVMIEDEVDRLESAVGRGEGGVSDLKKILLPNYADFDESDKKAVVGALRTILTNNEFDYEWLLSHVSLYFDAGENTQLFFRDIWESLFDTKVPLPE